MKRAFTIVELIVVVGIIAILMSVLLGTFSGSTESARAAKCEANLHNLAMAVQAVGMSSGYYPRSSTITYKDSQGNDKIVYGWLGEEDNPYETGTEARRTCFDKGTIWSVMKGDRSSYVCPSHEKYAKEKNLGVPLWSYQMNSYFSHGANETKQRRYGLSRADRFLLFAETPYARMDLAGSEIQAETSSGSALDGELDRKNEFIGFNHKDGRNVLGHVCFVDGHVERLRAPTDKGNIKQLTQWLCYPHDDSGDFDVSFNGSTYEKDSSSAD